MEMEKWFLEKADLLRNHLPFPHRIFYIKYCWEAEENYLKHHTPQFSCAGNSKTLYQINFKQSQQKGQLMIFQADNALKSQQMYLGLGKNLFVIHFIPAWPKLVTHPAMNIQILIKASCVYNSLLLSNSVAQ